MSTTDTILKLGSVVSNRINEGGVILAVSLDISNAFNTLPWPIINMALVTKGVPGYLCRVLGDYLRDRSLYYTVRGGEVLRGRVTCGVPQGSVLGPALWNVGYDSVLGLGLPAGCSTLCYADDTLVLIGGDTLGDAIPRAELAVARVIRGIKDLGLRLWGSCFPRIVGRAVWVDGVLVPVGNSLKYLGLTLDARWSFREHFNRVLPRAEMVMVNLSRIMPNLGGPGGKRRRLYANVVQSVLMYGAPVWASTLQKNRRVRERVLALQRRAALRVISAYRTVSLDSALLLARILPGDILASSYRRVYQRTVRAGEMGIELTIRARAQLRKEERCRAIDEWLSSLRNKEESEPGSIVRNALIPILREWIEAKHVASTFHSTQLLTGHGCFMQFLFRIGKQGSPTCAHCGGAVDSALHTLSECPSWADDREILKQKMGQELNVRVVLAESTKALEKWRAFQKFASKIMLRKEEAERQREKEERVRLRAGNPGVDPV